MRREFVATLRVGHREPTWDLRGVRVKGGKTRDIPLPAAVMTFPVGYVEEVTRRRRRCSGPHMGAPHHRQNASADDRQKPVAALLIGCPTLKLYEHSPVAAQARRAVLRGTDGAPAEHVAPTERVPCLRNFPR